MKYRLAAFDFDGTLADSFGWFVGVMGEVASRHKLKTVDPAELDTIRGYSSKELRRHWDIPMWKLPRIATHVRKLQARDIDQIRLFDGVGDMLRGLAGGGVLVAIVSSNAERNVRRVLGPELAALVAHYGCGASLLGKRAKLKTLLRKHKVSPAEAIYVGDEIRDVEAARGVGMASGAVSWGYATLDALKTESPTEVFVTRGEVVDRILNG